MPSHLVPLFKIKSMQRQRPNARAGYCFTVLGLEAWRTIEITGAPIGRKTSRWIIYKARESNYGKLKYQHRAIYVEVAATELASYVWEIFPCIENFEWCTGGRRGAAGHSGIGGIEQTAGDKVQFEIVSRAHIVEYARGFSSGATKIYDRWLVAWLPG